MVGQQPVGHCVAVRPRVHTLPAQLQTTRATNLPRQVLSTGLAAPFLHHPIVGLAVGFRVAMWSLALVCTALPFVGWRPPSHHVSPRLTPPHLAPPLLTVRGRLDVGGKVTFQLALYPGGGSRYARHSDASATCPTRRLTAILYLNPAWAAQVSRPCTPTFTWVVYGNAWRFERGLARSCHGAPTC